MILIKGWEGRVPRGEGEKRKESWQKRGKGNELMTAAADVRLPEKKERKKMEIFFLKKCKNVLFFGISVN